MSRSCVTQTGRGGGHEPGRRLHAPLLAETRPRRPLHRVDSPALTPAAHRSSRSAAAPGSPRYRSSVAVTGCSAMSSPGGGLRAPAEEPAQRRSALRRVQGPQGLRTRSAEPRRGPGQSRVEPVQPVRTRTPAGHLRHREDAGAPDPAPLPEPKPITQRCPERSDRDHPRDGSRRRLALRRLAAPEAEASARAEAEAGPEQRRNGPGTAPRRDLPGSTQPTAQRRAVPGTARAPSGARSADPGGRPPRADVQPQAGPHKAEAAREVLHSDLFREVPAPRPTPEPQVQADITAELHATRGLAPEAEPEVEIG